jgi:hypothetical protein
MSFDFIYYPLVYRAGREGRAIPGMHVMQAPSSAHRHRQHDLLAVFLNISGDHRYDPEEIEEMTRQASSAFFSIQGSVTRAMQTLAENLNKHIFDRNLDRGYEGIRALGTLNMAVLHNDWLFIGQVGNTRAFFINSDMVDIMAEKADPGAYLGLSRRIQMRYSQAALNPEDMILMSEQPPASWTVQNLSGCAALSMDQAKRRLLSQVTGSLEALVIKVKQGRGSVAAGDWREPQSTDEAQTISDEKPLAPAPQVEAVEEPLQEQIIQQPREQQPPQAVIEDEEQAAAFPAEDIQDESLEETQWDQEPVTVLPGETEQPLPEGAAPPPAAPMRSGPGAFMLGMAKAWMRLRNWAGKIGQFGNRVNSRFNQKEFNEKVGSPSFFMLIMALAIPLVLILSSITVYTRSGRAEEHQALLAEAQQAADLALEEEDALQQRDYWAQALDLVNQAQEYDITQESRALFEQAQSSLDDMDLAGRLDFLPALTQFFPEDVVITRIQSSPSGVYLLDETTGSVLRISSNSKGFYELDTEFDCSPRAYGLTTVTDLVDFVVLPANEDNYRVMALDEQGNLLYCRPDELAVSRTLSAPSGGWKQIAGVAYDDDILYVLDAEKDEVWMFEGRNPDNDDAAGIIFSESPSRFFDEDVPDLGGAIDLTVNEEDLYILHQDGHMSLCKYSALKDVKLTECQDPAPYNDSRVGREKKPWIFMDSRFELMQQTKLPNAAIYILDAGNRSINQFSYQLNLEKVLKPQINREYPVPDSDPTGFGVTTDLEVFLAYNNQLFIAPLK